MALAVGIDLGTTNSAVAMLDGHGRPVVVRNREGAATTPSVICFRDGEILVGAEAREMAAIGQWPVAAFFKRQMGDRHFLLHAGGVDHTPKDLSALVLGKLKSDAEAATGERIAHAVITVPAYFRDTERKATIEAGRAAGMDVLQVINEPTAAAIAYGAGRAAGSGRLVVYDLGGGTFDVTVLDLTGDGIRVRCTDGDHQLGGKDWDDRVIEFLGSRFHNEFGADPLESPESLVDLRVQAETAKKRLSAVDDTSVSVVHEGSRGRYALTRAKFEELTRDLLERTMSLVTRVVDDAYLHPEHIDGVLLVGGSTRMPAVRRRVEEVFRQPPRGGVNEDEAVALGAAIVAAERFAERNADSGGASPFMLPGAVKTIDVTNHSLGMIAVNADRSAYVNSVILPKNAEIPCEETRPYQQRTRRGAENRTEVFMTQGETERPDDVAYIGRYVVSDVPHEPSGITVVDVTYRYDRSGTVKVSASARKSGAPLPVVVEAVPADVPDRFLDAPHPQAEEPEHLNAYLVIDVSYSMAGAPLEAAKRAARGFLQNTDLGHCSLGVISFWDEVRVEIEATQNARSIDRAIAGLRLGPGTGGNPFIDILRLQKDVAGRRFAIILTDGRWFHPEDAIKSARACHDHGIEVIAIGFGDADSRFLNLIASSSETSFFTGMNEIAETFSSIAQVLAEAGGDRGGDAGQIRGRLGLLSADPGRPMVDENFYILLDLNPNVDDRDEIDDRIKCCQRTWSLDATQGSQDKRAEALRLLELIPQIQDKLLHDENERERMAAEAKKINKAQKEEALARLDSLIEGIKESVVEPELVKLLVEKAGGPVAEADVKSRLKEKRISVAAEEASARKRPPLETVVAQEIQRNLKLVEKKDLYDFLGMPRRSSCESLHREAYRLYQELSSKGTRPDVATRRDLANCCVVYLGDDANREGYDNTLRLQAMEQFDDNLEVAGRGDKYLSRDEVEHIVDSARSQGIEREVALEYIKNYARSCGFHVQPAARSSTPRARVCGFCDTLTKADGERCRGCGEQLVQPCPGCQNPTPTEDKCCSKCSFPTGDAQHIRGLLEEVGKHLAGADFAAAATCFDRVPDRWRNWEPALKEGRRMEEIRKRFEAVEALAADRKLLAAQKKLQPLERMYGTSGTKALRDDIESRLKDAWAAYRKAEAHRNAGRDEDAFTGYAEAVDGCVDFAKALERLRQFAPAPPSALRVSRRGGSAHLRWSPGASESEVRYRILRNEEGAPSDSEDGEVLCKEVAETSWDDPRVPTGVPWHYAVFAVRRGVASTTGAASGPHIFEKRIAQRVTYEVKGRWWPKICLEAESGVVKLCDLIVMVKPDNLPTGPGDGREVARCDELVFKQGQAEIDLRAVGQSGFVKLFFLSERDLSDFQLVPARRERLRLR